MNVEQCKSLYISIFVIVFFCCCSLVPMCRTAYSAGSPILLFSDLDSGPKNGWEGSSTKGAAVTVWGKNLGAIRGSNYLTVNGSHLTQDIDYAEWGVLGPARGLERITFWLNSSMIEGLGTISATVGGVTSNTLPFNIRRGRIKFISVSDGNNSYNGNYSSRLGHTGNDGPWKDLYMANPTQHTGAVVPGDTVYVRAGTYTQYDYGIDSLIGYYSKHIQNPVGLPIFLAGYPNEWPKLGTGTETGHAAIWTDYAVNMSNLGYSKLLFQWGVGGFSIQNIDNIRIIGNRFEHERKPAQSGVIYADAIQDAKILGNYFYQNGYDKYKHDLYLKCWTNKGRFSDCKNVEVGWNEFRESWCNPNAPSGDRGGPSLAFSTDGTMSRFINSTIHDNLWRDGVDSAIIIDTNSKNINIYNNVISNMSNNPGYRAVVYLQQAEHSNSTIPAGCDNIINFYNNTIYNSGERAGVIGIRNPIAWQRFNMKNNIIYSTKSSQAYIAGIDFGTEIISDHDLYYGSGGLPSVPRFTITNGINANPLFVDTFKNDFHLSSSSPAKDSGASSVKSVVTADYDRNPRPQGAEYDIGAFEYAP